MSRLFFWAATLALAASLGCDSSTSEPLAPVDFTDTEAFLSELSEPEKTCISESAASDNLMLRLSQGSVLDQPVIGCLEHEMVLRLLLTEELLDQTGPLSTESSECIRDGFASTDLAALVVALGSSGVEVNAAAGRMMAGFILTLSCLNDEEFDTAGSAIVLDPDTPESLQCVLEEFGGRAGLMALLQSDAGVGHPTDSFRAIYECRSQLSG